MKKSHEEKEEFKCNLSTLISLSEAAKNAWDSIFGRRNSVPSDEVSDDTLESALDSLQLVYDFNSDKIQIQSKDLGKDGKPLLDFTIEDEPIVAEPIAITFGTE